MKVILSAKTEQGQLIHLTNKFSREQLLELRTGSKFICPDCGNILYLKIGSIKIPHFAHKSHSDCDTYSEPESSLHLQGKLLLHDFFTSKHFSVELEKYLPEIRQRADLLVNGKTVIEFQCSTISVHDILRRTAAYSKLGLNSAWIFGINEKLENRMQIIRLMEYQKKMLMNRGHQKYLLLLNPNDGFFYYYSNLFYISGNRWAGKISTLSAAGQTFPFAVPKTLSRKDFDAMCAIFSQTRDGYIRSQMFAKNRYQNPYWLLCYKLRLDKRNLPTVIGVPILGAECITEHTVIWQLKVFRALQQGSSIQEVISSEIIMANKNQNADLFRQVLEDYSSFLQAMETSNKDTEKQNDVLYHIYCKSLRTLRK